MRKHLPLLYGLVLLAAFLLVVRSQWRTAAAERQEAAALRAIPAAQANDPAPGHPFAAPMSDEQRAAVHRTRAANRQARGR